MMMMSLNNGTYPEWIMLQLAGNSTENIDEVTANNNVATRNPHSFYIVHDMIHRRQVLYYISSANGEEQKVPLESRRGRAYTSLATSVKSMKPITQQLRHHRWLKH